MDLYTGTQQSVNTFFAQLEQQTGLCEPYRLAKEMGIDLDRPRPPSGCRRSPSASPNVSPLEMAEAYATFAARGLHCDPRPVTSIDDSDGNVLKDYPAQCQQVIAAPVADAVNDVLRGVRSPAASAPTPAASTSRRPARPAPSTDNMAVWFMGYTPQPGHRRDDRRRQPADGHWITLNGQTVGGTYISTRHGSDHRRPDVGRRDAGRSSSGCPTRLHPARRPGRRRRADHGARRRRA